MVMSEDLQTWQERLTNHFEVLRNHRIASRGARPLFGLEHGLNPVEVESLEAAIRSHIARFPPSRDHWLVWIAYSSELGYRYAGDEYWQTFESETPGWEANGNRYKIRDFYRRFQRDFRGAEPSGRWAEHFSIICWPIAHAILPKDLQVQLARILYELRHMLSGDVLESPGYLGNLIAARGWNASSRFQNFAEETSLLGQIAAALLLEGQTESADLIHPATLKRIKDDLDQERRARDWLRGARRSANQRVQMRGLGPLERHTKPARISQLHEAREEVAALGIEPRIILRPRTSSESSWEVFLEIPDLSHLLLRFPQTNSTLTGSRCKVAGSSGRPLARRRLLHGAQCVKLVKWPRPDEILLQFERRDPQLDFLLRTECLLRPGYTRLLRIASDGVAYECRSLRVRPGERYIILRIGDSVGSNRHTTSIHVECEGVDAEILDMPMSLATDSQASIQELGLEQARNFEVWPAGLSALAWDGDGYGEWLASERPCLAVLADHPLANLSVSLDRFPLQSFEVSSVEPGKPIFLELPLLPVGLHRLKFTVRSSLAGNLELLNDQQVEIRIREGQAFSSHIGARGPLMVQVEPETPTLEQLWQGEAELFLRGPKNRKVKCQARLFERNGEPPILSQYLPSVNLPSSPSTWEQHFDSYFRKDRGVQEAYDGSSICEVIFDADELGTFRLRCERTFTPIRWALRRRRSEYGLRLIDDSGNTVPPVVRHMSFESPNVEETVFVEPEIPVPRTGGLYTAQTSEHVASIVAPPMLKGLGFSELTIAPKVEHWTRSPDSAIRVIETANLWSQAILPGNLLSRIRRHTVLRCLVSELSRIICGEKWANAEEDFDSSRRDSKALELLSRNISKNPTETGVSSYLLTRAETMANESNPYRIAILTSAANQFQLLPGSILRPLRLRTSSTDISFPHWLAELALRLASDPAGARRWAGGKLRTGLTRLMDSSSLARSARFIVMAVEHYLPPTTGFQDIFSGWQWQSDA